MQESASGSQLQACAKTSYFVTLLVDSRSVPSATAIASAPRIRSPMWANGQAPSGTPFHQTRPLIPISYCLCSCCFRQSLSSVSCSQFLVTSLFGHSTFRITELTRHLKITNLISYDSAALSCGRSCSAWCLLRHVQPIRASTAHTCKEGCQFEAKLHSSAFSCYHFPHLLANSQ